MATASDVDFRLGAFLEAPDEVLIALGRRGLYSRKRGWLVLDYSVYSLPSLVTTTLSEEARLFCDSQMRKAQDSPDQILKRWKLDGFGKYKFSELSGGTRKFAMLALTCEAASSGEHVIACNIQHQLDGERLRLLIQNLELAGVAQLIFAEQNLLFLEQKLGISLSRAPLSELLAAFPSFES